MNAKARTGICLLSVMCLVFTAAAQTEYYVMVGKVKKYGYGLPCIQFVNCSQTSPVSRFLRGQLKLL